ncbi:hypothetical protein PN797_001163 [Enterobacter hormaechei]|nr:hypothetical protein [Enterobacter hormaechei]
MSNIDKHAVQAVADLKAGYTLGHADVAILNGLARIALASLEAEPVAYLFAGSATEAAQLGFPDELDDGQKANCIPLYAVPTAPVASVDSPEIPAVEPNWNDQTLREPGIWAYGFMEGQKVNLSHPQLEPASGSTTPPAPVSVPDEIRLLQSEVTIWKDRWELLRELFREVADALGCDLKDNQAMLDKIEMLQGAELVTTAYKLPEGYALVPVEPTREMMAAFALGADDIEYEPGKRWEDGECWYAEVNDADSFVSAYRCMLESVSIEGK